MNNYFTISREIFDHWVFADEKTLKIWIWLIGKARYEKGTISIKLGMGNHIVTLERGQLIFGRMSAEESLNLDGSLIYRRLQKLEQDKMISINANSHYTIITICNYDTYQHSNSINRTADEQPPNNQRTADEQPVNTNNNYNKYNKENKENKTFIEKNFNFDLKTFFPTFKSDQFFKLFDDYLIMRKSNGRIATVQVESLISTLQRIAKTEKDAIEIIKISLNSGYPDFYPLKKEETGMIGNPEFYKD